MKRVLSFFMCLMVLATKSSGQETTRQEADSMIKVLSRAKSGMDRLELLLNLAQFHIFKPGENKIDLDSAAGYIHEAKALNKTVNSPDASGYLLLTESYLLKESGSKADGKKFVEKSIGQLKSGINKDYLGKAYYELSMYYDYDDSLQLLKKIQLVQQSVDAFQQAGNPKRKARSLEMLGDLYIIADEEDKSLPVLKEALAIYNSINYPKLQGVYVLLGRSYYFKHEYGPALFNLLKALKTCQSVKDSSMQICQINNHLGMLYSYIDRQDMAVKYLNDALKTALKYKDESAIFWVVMNLSLAYNNLNQPDQSLKVLDYINKKVVLSENQNASLYTAYLRSYLLLKQLGNARPYCELAIKIADKKLAYSDHDRKARIYMYAADFYFLSNQYEKARYYLAKSNNNANLRNYAFAQIHNFELVSKLDSAQGNFMSAYKHLLKYKEKTDSVSSERKVRQFQVMNVEYEVGMKEDSIKSKNKDILFLTQKNNLQQENLRQASLIRNITVGGIILAFIIIGLLYRLYRQKQKSNRLLQSQKDKINKSNQELRHLNERQTKLLIEKEWLAKEIHHRVKNNLQMVVSLLNAQTEFLTHPSALDAIKESRERMQAIAIIHQKLYQLDNSTQVNMRSYISELTDNIKNSFADSERIKFKVDVADVNLDVSQSVPLGLILNEAITNSIKYAYSKNENGLIQISLKHPDGDRLQLKIADNGKGLPAEVDIKHSNSLGMKLIRLFSEQLEGDLYFINNNGLEITLNFEATGYHDAALNKIIA